MSDILIRPLITEKTTLLGQNPKQNKFAFVVAQGANKIEIKNAVERMYSVQVKQVNTQRRAGKIKQRNTKAGLTRGVAGRYKKAYVTLKAGETIDFYGNV